MRPCFLPIVAKPQIGGGAMTNWALAGNGGSITTTNTFGGYPESRIIDGNKVSSEWYSSGPTVPHYVEITLASAKSCSKVEVYGLSSYPADWTLEYYNGSSWVVLDTVVNVYRVTHNFSPVTASQFRLNISTIRNSYASFYEIEVWGT